MVTFQLESQQSDESSDSKPTFGDNLGKSKLQTAVKEYANWYVDNHDALSEVELDKVNFSSKKNQ